MATRTGNASWTEDGRFKAVWEGITEADTGSSVGVPGNVKDLTAQVVGDFTSSGAITWEGSNDGSTWATITYENGTDAVVTNSILVKFDMVPAFIRPKATAGSAVDMDAYLFGSR